MAIATTTAKNSLATKYGADATHAALFTADPGTTGSVTGEVSGGGYARKPITWGAPTNGVVTGSVEFTVPASTTITHAAVCSASSGANLLDKVAITSQTFATAGTYELALTFTLT